MEPSSFGPNDFSHEDNFDLFSLTVFILVASISFSSRKLLGSITRAELDNPLIIKTSLCLGARTIFPKILCRS